MNFLSADWLYGLLVLIPLILLGGLLLLREQKQLKSFAQSTFLVQLFPAYSFRRKIIRLIFFVLAFAFFLMALANPQWGFETQDVVRQGSDLMLVVDLSNSMLAEDIKPNRLERAKREIIDLLHLAQGDRLGLTVFAGSSMLICPLTLDYGALKPFVDTLSTELIPVQGSEIAQALEQAIASFREESHSKAILLLTDGEDHGQEIESVLLELKKKQIPLFILGMGTPEGAPIPLPKGIGGFKKDKNNQVVMSQLHESELKHWAEATGGLYTSSSIGEEDLELLYTQGLKKQLSPEKLQTDHKQLPILRFQWALGAGLLLLFLEGLLTSHRRRIKASGE